MVLDKYWVEFLTIPPDLLEIRLPPLVSVWISNDLEVGNSLLGVLLPRDGSGWL